MQKLKAGILTFLIVVTTQANEIALTFDDAPRGDGKIYSGKERAQRIIDVLRKEKIQAAFFVNPERFQYNDNLKRIQSYSSAGHIIANHTYSHPSLRRTSVAEYRDEIIRADKLIQQFPTYTKWFRFPFLHEGDTVEARDAIRETLSSLGYKNGYVTVDNYDFFIDDLVQQALAKGQNVNLDRACEMLNDLMWDGISFYDTIAKKYIGNVRHVLLMHENDIEALCLDKLIQHINSKGWKIISPGVAFADPLMQTEPNTLYLGQGRVAAIAHVRSGKKYVSKWESTKALTAEFLRRNIVEPSIK